MFCDNCGKQNIKIAKFCKYCGNKLSKNKKTDYLSNKNDVLQENLLQENSAEQERKIQRNSIEHIITRLVISSIDFFFAGIFFLLIAIIILDTILDTNLDTNLTTFTTVLVPYASWLSYVFFVHLILNGKTIGERVLNMRIETKKRFLSNLLGPLIIFDYILGTTFYIRPMKGRSFSYVACIILLTWWEYLFFGILLFMPFFEK